VATGRYRYADINPIVKLLKHAALPEWGRPCAASRWRAIARSLSKEVPAATTRNVFPGNRRERMPMPTSCAKRQRLAAFGQQSILMRLTVSQRACRRVRDARHRPGVPLAGFPFN